MAIGPDGLEEPQGLGVAAEEDMLAVVNEGSGDAVVIRRGASTQPRPRLEHDDAQATRRQVDGRTQPGKAPADDRGVEGRHQVRARRSRPTGPSGSAASCAPIPGRR